MTKYQIVKLHRGKEVPIVNHHHWIYSGAVERLPSFENGDILEVRSFDNRTLGYGYFNKNTNIVGRMLSYGKDDPIDAIKQNIILAYELRKKLFDENITNSYRLINSEGDRIPGLTVDKYNNTLVLQVSTIGIEKLKKTIVDLLIEIIKPDQIFEKSNMPSRRIEGLGDSQSFLYVKDKQQDVIEMLENGIKYSINLNNSHKTGFYLDQREMRKLVREMGNGKRVLNCFSYTGGFSVAAIKGGAKHVTSVDISKEVIEQAKENFKLNDIDPTKHEFIASDVFSFFDLQLSPFNFNLVILDPPAFAKKKADYTHACNAYRKLNRTAMKTMTSGSFLLTCSCSYHVDEESFKRILFQAALDAKKEIKILQSHRHAMDHVINIYHPEMNYLKSYLLYIE